MNTRNKKKHEVIDGIRVDVSMPEEQKKILRNKDSKSVMHDKDFEPQNVKQRVSIMLDSDIITAARNQAQSRGTRYQTLINEVLRQILIDGNSANKEVLELARSITDGIAALAESRSVEGRLNRIEEKLDNLSVKVS